MKDHSRLTQTILNFDINAIDTDGNTKLHLEALKGNLEMMNSLLNQGAKFDIINISGKNALELITDENQQKKLFLQAIETNNLELVKTLFEMGFKYDETGRLFKNAVESRNLELISFMVKDIGIDPYECDTLYRVEGRTCHNFKNPVDLSIAILLNPNIFPTKDRIDGDSLPKHEDIIKFFLENGAMPNRDSFNRIDYSKFLDNLPPDLKEHILKYYRASHLFDASENAPEIKRVINLFLQDGANLESVKEITISSDSGETTKFEKIELTAFGIINLHRHLSFNKLMYMDEIKDEIEKLHNKIIKSRSKISLKEKLSDSAGIAPPASIDSRGLGAEQPSAKRTKI